MSSSQLFRAPSPHSPLKPTKLLNIWCLLKCPLHGVVNHWLLIEDDIPAHLYLSFVQKNSVTFAVWLISYHVACLTPTVASCENAKAAWDALQCIYKGRSAARQLQLKRELSNLKKDANEPLSKYFARARGLYAQLKAAGDSIQEADIVNPILAGLPSDYDTIITVIVTISGEQQPSLDEVLTMLLPVEQSIYNKAERTTKAFLTSARRPYHNGRRPSAIPVVPPRPSMDCWYCGRKGHQEKDCRKKMSDQQGRGQVRGQQQRGSTALMCLDQQSHV